MTNTKNFQQSPILALTTVFQGGGGAFKVRKLVLVSQFFFFLCTELMFIQPKPATLNLWCVCSTGDLPVIPWERANRQASVELKRSIYLAEDWQVPLEALCSVGYWACV